MDSIASSYVPSLNALLLAIAISRTKVNKVFTYEIIID